jgi:hypothetical protein
VKRGVKVALATPARRDPADILLRAVARAADSPSRRSPR